MLQSFLLWLNEFHPNIKFTMSNPSTEGTEFLETYVYMKNGNLCTKSYSKPCDSHAFLIPSSCHPTHTIKNIPYNTAHRIFKLSTEPEEFEKSKIEYTDHLLKRGYNHKSIAEQFSKVEKLNRDELIYPTNSKNKTEREQNFPLVCDFNPALPPIGKIFNQHKHILELDPILKKAIPTNNVFVSYRGNKTIKDLLIPSKLRNAPSNTINPIPTPNPNPINNLEIGCYPCAKRCKLCKYYLVTTQVAKSHHSDNVVNITQTLNCNANNIIYLVKDKICGKSYIGCTSTSMSIRWNNHKSQIKKEVTNCNLAIHFSQNKDVHPLDKSTYNKYDECLSQQLDVTIIEQVESCNNWENGETRLAKCKVRENYWQNQLKTMTIWGGLNKYTCSDSI